MTNALFTRMNCSYHSFFSSFDIQIVLSCLSVLDRMLDTGENKGGQGRSQPPPSKSLSLLWVPHHSDFLIKPTFVVYFINSSIIFPFTKEKLHWCARSFEEAIAKPLGLYTPFYFKKLIKDLKGLLLNAASFSLSIVIVQANIYHIQNKK